MLKFFPGKKYFSRGAAKISHKQDFANKTLLPHI